MIFFVVIEWNKVINSFLRVLKRLKPFKKAIQVQYCLTGNIFYATELLPIRYKHTQTSKVYGPIIPYRTPLGPNSIRIEPRVDKDKICKNVFGAHLCIVL